MLYLPSRVVRFPLLIVACFFLPPPALGQDSGNEKIIPRGDRAELSVTVRDSSGEPISAPAIVKLYHDGVPADQSAAAHGRAFFVFRTLGTYTLVVEANGYKSAEKEVTVPVAMKFEVDVYLQRVPASNETAGVPGKPLLAPKAKEALDKGLQALGENKLKEAEKHVDEAAKLAPGHPDVLFVQGVLFLSLHDWTQAQSVLEKAAQMDPSNPRIFSALGMALTDQGKYDEAVPPLEKSLQLEAGAVGGWETHWALGKAYYHRRQYDQALKTSQLALTESNGKAPQIELLVAQSLTAVGRYDDAAETLREFLKRHGDRPEAATAKRWLDGLANNGKTHQN
ncbi:MAG TPA: tetratricopeptide repeat protein [Candidatus Acidoferrum sp.]|nr:tetratricopeptide repeat protein [Candidatus Acidoferrum sp.]